jgi:hypothetical protein
MAKMLSNICLGCRFGSVKIDVHAPENCDVTEIVQKTRDFATTLIEVTKRKPIHYSVSFDSVQDLSTLDFRVECSCILNVAKDDCSKLSDKRIGKCKVKHFHNYMQPKPKEVKLQATTK